MKQYVALLENMNTHSRTWVKSWPEEDLDTFKKMMPERTEKLFDDFKEALSQIKECKISLEDYIKESKFDID